MIVERIELENWLCFRGEHELVLGEGVFAVTASREDDPDRSNGSGKTAFLEAIRFALTGKHRKRIDDAWISTGEKKGGVWLVLSNGMTIARTKQIGKAEQLLVEWAEIAKTRQAVQDKAQEYIDRECALFSTCYVGQKQIDRLVTADPGERMAEMGGWVNLGPLQACEADVRAQLNALLTTQAALRAKLEVQRGAGRPAPAVPIPELQERVEQARGALGLAEDALDKSRAAARDATQAAQYAEVVARGVELKERASKADLGALRADLEKARVATREVAKPAGVKERELKDKRELATEGFDGCCPVSGQQCPVRDEINAATRRNAGMLRRAQAEWEVADEKYKAAVSQEGALLTDIARAEKLDADLAALREKARILQPAAKRHKEAAGLGNADAWQTAVANKRAALADAEAALRLAVHHQADDERRAKETAELELQAKDVDARLQTAREALAVFGRNGAQRRVAEAAFAEIQDRANQMLTDAGIDLSVAVSWARETKDLAEACDACGTPFPRSTKARECTRCAAPRGPKLSNRLELDLSYRSGAAEDLAGVAVQLAGAQWLRDERGSEWGTFVLDEAFASLDRGLKRAFAAHVVRMIQGGGFRQGFIVAHDRSVTDTMPRRIEVVAGPNGSRASVH